jgi:hypothetical protein
MSDLTPKQERFCHEIVKGASQSDAYRAAISSKGQPNTIHINASKLMASTKVRLRIEELQAPVVESVRLTMQRRLEEVAHAVEFNPKECFDEHGQPIPIKDLPDHVARAIAGYELDPEKFTTKIKFIDKLAATKLYTQFLGDQPIVEKRTLPPPPKTYDPHQLTKEEWEEYKRIRRKALVVNE